MSRSSRRLRNQATRNPARKNETVAESAPDLGEDSVEEAPASAASEPTEAPATEQAEDAPEVFRTPDYEEKIRSIQNAPLRTPKPDVPPLPGVTYVNPWT